MSIKNKKEPNYKEVYRYLEKGMVNATHETWFRNIFQVKQGCFLKFKKNQSVQEINYYDLKNRIDENDDYKKKQKV